MALASVSAPLGAFAQPTVVEDGITLARTVDASSVGAVHGLSIDEETGAVFFIADTGDDLYTLAPDDTFTQIADDVGRFIGILSDLRVGPDGLIYVGDSFLASGETNGDIFRFQQDGTFVDTFASVTIGAGSNAFGMDFDCAGDLYASETGTNLYRISPAGDVSVFSTGWVDVDEIERGENNQMFILDGSARMDEWGTVFLHEPDGTLRRYAEGLPRIHSATFDRGTGDVIVGTFSTGEIIRLRDEDGSGVIEADERFSLATGFGTNDLVDLDYGPASDGVGYAIYAVSDGNIYELTGFGAPRFGGCGAGFDDDGDGFCDRGVDLNGDGDCNDAGEDTDDVDCNDDEPLSSPGLIEVCNDGIDNDCNAATDLDDDACADFDTDMDGIVDRIEVLNGDSDRDGMDDFEDPDDD
ncbi:MAG: MopE-related protein, partial [Myxococcota bacterium]